MGWGVLADSHMAAPPGTANLAALHSIGKTTRFLRVSEFAKKYSEDPSIESEKLKKDGNIVLQPQPSEDPNDPLNWYDSPNINWNNH